MDRATARGIVGEVAPEIFHADHSVRGVGIGFRHGEYTLDVIRNVARGLPHNSPAGPLPRQRLSLPVRLVEIRQDPRPLPLLAFLGPGSPAAPPTLAEQLRHRNLYCGIQVQNFHEDERRGFIRASKISMGTLGCFVLSSTGDPCALSNAHVIGNPGNAPGDSILQPGNIVIGSGDEIAVLEQSAYPEPSPNGMMPGDPDCKLNTIDAAVARLTTQFLCGSWYHQAFLPATNAPSPPTRAAPPFSCAWNEPVFKVGRSTGLTRGQTYSFAMQLVFRYDHGDCWFDDVIAIEPTDPHPVFSTSGDSGSVVLKEKGGEILGLLFGGDNMFTYACSIDAALQRFHCSLP